MTPTVRSFHSDILERIREDPYRILGQASLGCLRAFFGGHDAGCARAGKSADIDPRLDRFSEWVAEKLGRNRLSVSGVCMIQLESEDEERALNRYFELWDEFTLLEPEAIPPDTWPAPPIQIKNLDDLLARVRLRPGMYLGHASVTLLHAFLLGYLDALRDTRYHAKESTLLESFDPWLCSRYRMRLGYRWDRLLLFFDRDEARALDSFFTQFDEFLAELKARP